MKEAKETNLNGKELEVVGNLYENRELATIMKSAELANRLLDYVNEQQNALNELRSSIQEYLTFLESEFNRLKENK